MIPVSSILKNFSIVTCRRCYDPFEGFVQNELSIPENDFVVIDQFRHQFVAVITGITL